MHISSILYEDPSFGGNINKQDLIKVSKKFFLGDYTDNAQGKAAEAAIKLVDHLTGRAWILHEVGDEVFEFTHRTFLEFFYAQSLDARFEVTEDLLNDLLPYIREGQRTLPAHLSLQMRARDKRAVSDRIAKYLTTAAKNVSVLRFCSETLEYLTPNGEALLEYVRHLTKLAVQVKDNRSLLHIVGTENPLRSVIFSAFADEFVKIGSVEKLAFFSPVLDSLARVSGFATKAATPELAASMQRITGAFWTWQRRSPFVARWIFDCTGSPDWDVVRAFNLRLWTNKWAKGRSEGLLADSAQMLSELASHASGWPLGELAYAKLALEIAEESFRSAGSHELNTSYYNMRGFRADSGADNIDFESLDEKLLHAMLFASMLSVEGHEIYSFIERPTERKGRNIFEYLKGKQYRYSGLLNRWANAEVSLFGGSRGKETRDRAISQFR